ncbi:zinc finger, CCHC-type containing protein [Tanacetum coccineum]
MKFKLLLFVVMLMLVVVTRVDAPVDHHHHKLISAAVSHAMKPPVFFTDATTSNIFAVVYFVLGQQLASIASGYTLHLLNTNSNQRGSQEGKNAENILGSQSERVANVYIKRHWWDKTSLETSKGKEGNSCRLQGDVEQDSILRTTRDLDEITLDEITGKLKAFEERIKLRKGGQVESQENLLFAQGEHSGKGRRFSKRGGRSNFSRGNWQNNRNKRNSKEGNSNHKGNSNRNKSEWDLSKVRCYKCQKLGHLRKDCRGTSTTQERKHLNTKKWMSNLLAKVVNITMSQRCNADKTYLPLVCEGEETPFGFSADAFPGHVFKGRITKALRFSLGIKRASALDYQNKIPNGIHNSKSPISIV